jgi:V8-like Glu-specific endopeptidase
MYSVKNFNPQSLSEQILFSVVCIKAQNKNGHQSVGTGFLFIHTINDKKIRLVVTNKHVLDDCDQVKITFHKATDSQLPSGEFQTVEISNLAQKIFSHPDVDLCAIDYSPIESQLREINVNIFAIFNDLTVLPSDHELSSLRAFEEITMVGYPIGLSDEKNNLPLLRRGSTASHPAMDFNHEPVFVVDLACFPGSSGSPVFLLNEGLYSEKSGTAKAGSRLKLLGVLFAGPVTTLEGDVETQKVPLRTKMTAKVSSMIHLGFVIKSRKLVELINMLPTK